MKTFCLIALCIAISGCATKPTALEDAAGVPESRVANLALLKEKTGTVEIVLIRQDAAVIGIAAAATIYMDNEPLVSLLSGQKVSIWVQPGLHIFNLTIKERSNQLFAPFDLKSSLDRIEVEAKQDRRYVVRTDLANMSSPRFVAKSFELSSKN